jgi:hypothetical protein
MSNTNRSSGFLRVVVALAPWAGMLAAAMHLGCSGEVTVTQGDTGENTGEGGIVDSGPATCEPGTTPAPSDAVFLDVTGARSAAFIGDNLHLEAKVAGMDRYLVLAIESQSLARAVGMPEALLGPANLAEVATGTHARVRALPDGGGIVEVVSTADPAAPALIGSLPLAGEVDGPAVFSATEHRLFFCMRPAAKEDRQFVSVDLSDPTKPGEPQAVDSIVCNFYDSARFAAVGSTWISWNQPTGTYVQQTDTYAVHAAGVKHLVDYGYNQTGVHQYGNVVDAATNGVRAVFDPENESQFLLVDQMDGPGASFAWAYLGMKGPKRLLGVADTTLYLTTAEGVRAYDIADIESPELSPYEAAIAFGDGAPRLLAASDRFLVVADGEDALYLVPRDAPGEVAPLKVYQGDEPPAAADPPCDE